MTMRMHFGLGSSTLAAMLLSGFGLIAIALVSGACGTTPPTGSGTSGAPASGGEADAGATDASCTGAFPVSQPLSAPCCTEWGIDACGAGLFCAALDGRTQATCYPERSRRHREGCLADNQCVSEHCHPVTKTCSLPPGASCNQGDPCDRDDKGVPHECVESRCTATPCDPIYQTGCAESETCDLVEATAGCRKAGPSKLGEPCSDLMGAECVRGLTCYGVCRRICSSDADCPGESYCIKLAANSFGRCMN